MYVGSKISVFRKKSKVYEWEKGKDELKMDEGCS